MKMYFSQSSRSNRTLSEKEIERNALLSDLEKTKQALEVAYAGFDNVTEPDLIDCYIYEVNSVYKRYKFLMEQAARIALLPDENSDSEPAALSTETPVTSLVG
ncbi:MAG: YaaL family protein [Lachnospiraceae bacterium]|nr:YaaL family protein [Lachnospiraceae bacterium]